MDHLDGRFPSWIASLRPYRLIVYLSEQADCYNSKGVMPK
jgi:hypothetical protein